jgi:ribosomal protein L21E
LNKYQIGDQVTVKISEPYSNDEIIELGCHPDINGKTGKIDFVEETKEGYLYHLILDEFLNPHYLHKHIYDEPFNEYKEFEENLMK